MDTKSVSTVHTGCRVEEENIQTGLNPKVDIFHNQILQNSNSTWTYSASHASASRKRPAVSVLFHQDLGGLEKLVCATNRQC